MARNLQPKGKLSRREGVKLFLKAEKIFSPKTQATVRRNYPPGVHGVSNTKRRQTTYGKQLREKQKAKRSYHLMEKQFKNYYLKATKMSGDAVENLLRLLETRLDNVVFRLGLVEEREIARQLVSHGHVLVNGKVVKIPSYQVKIGQQITLTDKAKQQKYWQERVKQLKNLQLLGWLSFDAETASGKIVSLPNKQELPLPFDPTLILEFYSR